jgi:hypothetical protein
MRLNRKIVFPLLAILAAAPFSGVAEAQPSDARTRKDLSAKGILSIRLLGRGSRVWSDVHKQYMWHRSAVIVRTAQLREFPNAKLEIGGIATYFIVGGGYSFNRFLVGYNSYSGIPAPSTKTVLGLVNANLAEFLGDYYYRSSVGEVQPIALASDPKWEWHSPNSVSLRLTSGITQKISSTELEKKKIVMNVRLYRDSIKSPWTKWGSSRESEVSLGKITRSEDEIKAMKSLHFIALERAAAAHLKALPAVSIPAFKSDLEMFAFLHKTLREDGAAKTEAVLRGLLAPRYFLEGSSILLDSNGENLIENALKEAFRGKSTYAEQYGAEPNIESYSPNNITFVNADGRHRSSIELEPTGGTWQNGVKVGQSLRIAGFGVGVNENPDEIARLRSIPAATRFARSPGAKTFAEWGGQVIVEQKAQEHRAEVKAIQWKPFTSTKARLTIAFPGVPTETEGQMNDKYPMWTVEANHPQVLCRAITVLYPTRLNRMQAQNTVNSALQLLAQSNGATLHDTTELNEGTYGQVATLKKEGSEIKARVFVGGNTLYQLIMSASPTTMATLSGREFFGSFQPLR